MPFRNSIAGRTAKLLLVDDQPDNLKILASLLGNLGYDIVPASNGPQALERLSATSPDLVLLDMLMPGMDGFEVCRRIKADPDFEDLPIIFVSAADDPNIIARALEAGGVDYVTKPYNKAELLSRVRTHLALSSAKVALRALAEDKDELLGILTHDLKNHLAGMHMSAEMLAERAGSLGGNSAKLVSNILDSTRRMLSFVKEFLANQAAERLTPRLGSVRVADYAAQAVERHRPLAEVKAITLHYCCETGPGAASADHEALDQVLDNLISNAIKFSPAGTSVTVSVGADPQGEVILSVRDEGPGFNETDRNKLFRRYGRLTARPTGGEPSTGLGLSIVRRLVESMNGQVSLSPDTDRGAEFVVRLKPAGS